MALTRHSAHHFQRLDPSRSEVPLGILARSLPPVVYFMRTRDDLIKIGYTTDLSQRKRHFGSGWDHVLAVKPGNREDEKELHRRFAQHLARGEEYFRPARPIIDYINTLRLALGVKPIPAAKAAPKS